MDKPTVKELRTYQPMNLPGTPSKFHQWIGKLVTVTGWYPLFERQEGAVQWAGFVKELNMQIPEEDLCKPVV